MSGIFGVIDLQEKQINLDIYSRSIKSLTHRGKDGIFSTSSKNAFFTYFHTHTTYASFYEQQPIKNDNLLIVADLRLDNRDSLYEFLQITTPISDSQLIRLAYEKWGEQGFEKLIGDFSIVIFDQAQKKIFLVRDYSGVRPLYYTIWNNKLVFSSEIKGITNLPSFQIQPCKARIKEYLTVPGIAKKYQRETFYENIYQVLPAHYYSYDLNKGSQKEYCFWDINQSEYKLMSDKKLLEEFEKIFYQTIKNRTHSPFNIASIISGGIDSSSVTIIANQCIDTLKQQLSTYFFRPCIDNTFEEKKVNDFIKQTQLAYFVTDYGTDLINNSDRICSITDSPELYPIKYNTLRSIFEKIQENECRILLTGTDGDTVVGMGNDVFKEALKEKNIPLFIQHINEKYQLIEDDLHSNYGNDLNSMYADIISTTLNSSINAFGKIKGITIGLKILIEKKIFKMGGLLYILKKRFAIENNQLKKFTKANAPINDTGLSFFKSGNTFQLSTERQEYLSHLGAFYTVEVSHPILDKRLIEICYFISDKVKFWNGKTRGPLRYTTEKFLPESYRQSKTKSDNDYLITLEKETYHDTEKVMRFLEKNKTIIDNLAVEYNILSHDKIINRFNKIPFYQLNRIIELVSWLKNIQKYTPKK